MAEGKVKVVNVFPLNELAKHEKTEHCKCDPKVERFGALGQVVVHNLIDGGKYFDIDVDDKRWSSMKFTSV